MHNDYADRKNGRQEVTYDHPDLEEILADTYGLMIYQESVMRVAQRFAGYTLAEADNLRKACGKKDRALIATERERFVDGCEATGYGRDIGVRLFDIIEPFADYAFNKSHSYGYGLVAYQTAYLKAHYPVEYFAALLTSVKSNLDKAAVYLNECRQKGIEVLVPDVNVSASNFTAIVVDEDRSGSGSIPFGLSAVRNVGEGLVSLICAEREAGGPFSDYYDFCERVDTSVLNKRAVESLIKAGAFDSLCHPRRGLLAVFEQIVDQTLARRRREAEGQFDLFSVADGAEVTQSRIPIPDLEFDRAQALAAEKEMLGLYVSDHPLKGAERVLGRLTDATLDQLEELDDGATRTFGGVISGLSRKWTKKGELMATFTLEDLRARVEVMVFPRPMQEHGHKLAEDTVVSMTARVDKREETLKLVATDLDVVEGLGGAAPVRIKLPVTSVDEARLEKLKDLLAEHPGEAEVHIHLGEQQVLRLPDLFCVDPSNGLVAELRVLFGPEAVLA